MNNINLITVIGCNNKNNSTEECKKFYLTEQLTLQNLGLQLQLKFNKMIREIAIVISFTKKFFGIPFRYIQLKDFYLSSYHTFAGMAKLYLFLQFKILTLIFDTSLSKRSISDI